MSLWPVPLSGAASRFPRVSGDEPALCEAVKGLGVFSPRERG